MDPIRRRESVCRSLFGPVDHEQLRRELKQKLREMNEQDNRRWNFNFQTETPLQGRFEWEEVLQDEEDEEERVEEERAGTDQENCSSISNKIPAEETPVRRKRTRTKPAAKPGSNARITDFFAKRRRTTETKAHFYTSSSEAAQCKTIR